MSDSKKPDFDVVISKTSEKDGEKKNYYSNVGAAWSVAKGGISISLDSIPVDGKMVLFPRKEKSSQEATA